MNNSEYLLDIYPYTAIQALGLSPEEVNPFEFMRVAEECLDDKHMMVFFSRYSNKLTYREIGEVLGITSSRVGQILHKANRKMGNRANRYLIVPKQEYFIMQKKFIMSQKEIDTLTNLVKTAEKSGYVVVNDNKYIIELDLSVRSYNALKRAGIETLSDLAQYTQEELANIRLLGRHSLNEIVEKAKENGVIIPERRKVTSDNA